MDLKDLPWWKYHNTVEYLPREELIRRIDEVPLTVELIKSFLDNWVLSFQFIDAGEEYHAMSYSIPSNDLSHGFSKFGMMINSGISLEDKAESIIHEAVHLIYKARDTNELEPIVVEASKKLYNEDKELFNSFVEKYLLVK
ncbi:MAG: hypothetical protein AABY32_00215 [Nanoarchaeota archaeon]|mgnify:CR=1 FL=1